MEVDRAGWVRVERSVRWLHGVAELGLLLFRLHAVADEPVTDGQHVFTGSQKNGPL